MRRLSDPEAHRGRTALIDGKYPEGMKGRCSICSKVSSIEEGKMVDAPRSSRGPARAFVCAGCLSDRSEDAA